MFLPYTLTKDGFESHFAVNYLGHFLLTHLLLPCLKAAAVKTGHTARVVNVSSTSQYYNWFQFNDIQAKYEKLSNRGGSQLE